MNTVHIPDVDETRTLIETISDGLFEREDLCHRLVKDDPAFNMAIQVMIGMADLPASEALFRLHRVMYEAFFMAGYDAGLRAAKMPTFIVFADDADVDKEPAA